MILGWYSVFRINISFAMQELFSHFCCSFTTTWVPVMQWYAKFHIAKAAFPVVLRILY
jgi:hypothetical protein